MIDHRDLSAISCLLDEALDLPDDAARQRWLDALGPEHEALRPTLRKLLKAHDSACSLLDRGPQLPGVPGGPAIQAGLSHGDIVGTWRLERELGRGGMSVVWLARSEATAADRAAGNALPASRVALKFPAVSLDGRAFLARFARERDFLQRLDHPGIARLVEAGVTDGGQHYLALEYVDGQKLDTYCDAERLGVHGRLAMFQQVLQAVEHAHSRSVLHRDLKPSNILVTPAGQVRLLDFGIAKLLVDGLAQETELTAQWGRALTRDYASPEQLAGQPVSARSDVYTLGVILHELLCGQRPDTASRDAGAGDDGAFLGVELTPPSECCSAKAPVATAEGGATALSRQLAGDLDAIVLRALRLNPAARYPDAAAMAEDIARVLSREPAQPTLQRWRLRLVLMLRRHRAAVSLSSLLFLGIAMLGHAHRAAGDIETLFAPTLPEPQRVVLINVGTEDLQRVFHGVRPLDPATFQKLVARISDGQPAVLGVDIDTSAPAYKVLPQGMAPEALQRIVWARGITASDRTDQLPDPRPVLGSDFAETPARSGLALSVADGNSGAVRWFVRLIPTVRGPLPSFATEVVRGLSASDERLPTALRSVRYWRGERTEFPVSVVLAPGFDWQDRIKGRVVLLGGSYDPADVHPTSLGLMHGLEVQANIVETELSGTAYIRPSVGAILIVGLANLAAAIGFFGHMRARWAIPASLAFGFGLAAATAAAGWFPAWPYAVMAALVALANQTVAELLHRRGWSLGRGLRTLWQRRTGTGSRP